MDGAGLHERMVAAAGNRTNRALADLTGVHQETVRRYMLGQAPSVEFVAKLCAALEISAHWMLTGEGPMRQRDAHLLSLNRANPGDLLSAIATALESLTDRVGRIERFVHQLEAHLEAQLEARTPPATATDGHPPDPTPPQDALARAKRIADGVAKRPRPDAR